MTIVTANFFHNQSARQLHDELNAIAASEYIMDANEPIILILSDLAYWLDGYKRGQATYIEFVHLASRAIECLESYGASYDTSKLWEGIE